MRIWSPQAMEIMEAARQKAMAMNHAELDPLHLLWAFLREAALTGGPALRSGMEPGKAIHRTEKEMESLPQAHHTLVVNPNSALKKLFLRAEDLASVTDENDEMGSIGPHELVLALVADRGPAGDMLRNLEVKEASMVG